MREIHRNNCSTLFIKRHITSIEFCIVFGKFSTNKCVFLVFIEKRLEILDVICMFKRLLLQQKQTIEQKKKRARWRCSREDKNVWWTLRSRDVSVVEAPQWLNISALRRQSNMQKDFPQLDNMIMVLIWLFKSFFPEIFDKLRSSWNWNIHDE